MQAMKIFRELVLRFKSSKGQSIVEISLITPLLLVALYIPADFGVAFFMGNILANAAREGSRIGSAMGKSGGNEADRNFTSADAATVRDTVIPKMPSMVTGRSVRVRFYEDTAANCLEFIEVTASGNYNFFLYQILRLFGSTVPDSVTISRTTQMPYRYQPYGNETRCAGPPAVDEFYDNV
jgi:Flp pilus assembly protein TadG